MYTMDPDGLKLRDSDINIAQQMRNPKKYIFTKN